MFKIAGVSLNMFPFFFPLFPIGDCRLSDIEVLCTRETLVVYLVYFRHFLLRLFPDYLQEIMTVFWYRHSILKRHFSIHQD